jgi:hypothetical protein
LIVYTAVHASAIQKSPIIKTRKHLNADALFSSVHQSFQNVPDHRTGSVKVSMADALMSGFAMFSLKDPSLLAFEQRRINGESNLHSIYHINEIPSDTQMRSILDPIDPEDLRDAFKSPFSAIAESKTT